VRRAQAKNFLGSKGQYYSTNLLRGLSTRTKEDVVQWESLEETEFLWSERAHAVRMIIVGIQVKEDLLHMQYKCVALPA
jgi:hypothetical protein